MTPLEMRGDYDWSEAFNFAEGFDKGDVVEIAHYADGDNDGPAWVMVGRLEDGRYFYLSAWCDYTGWDCVAGGDSATGESLEDVLRFATDDERERMAVRWAP